MIQLNHALKGFDVMSSPDPSERAELAKEVSKARGSPLPRFEDEPTDARIARYKLVKEMAEGVTRAIQMYMVWALLAYFAKKTNAWPAIVATQLMGVSILAYVVATPVLALMEFRKASGPNQVGIFFVAALGSVIIFWGGGIQALMFSDIIVDKINEITHPAPVAAIARSN